jgi:anti-anti-sigma regulatory factor
VAALDRTIITTRRGPATVTVVGELDRVAIARQRAHLGELIEAGVSDLMLDLSAASQQDPALPRVLDWARTRIRGQGGRFTITGASVGGEQRSDAPN